MQLTKRIFISLINFQQIVFAVFYCVFAIFFAKYDDRNVGPSVIYMGYVMLSVAICQITNLLYWFFVRRTPSEVYYLRNIAVAAFSLVIMSVWLGQHYAYWGSSHR
ncbi:hypothetical protein SAMN04515619_106147 [Collimonas sp. OK412]|jgi:uncharacterized membrane protein|nr:hypothetical protein SAMN04515619_106147 [Collimonas sp. OK412]